MAIDTAAPTVVAVFFTDFGCGHKFEVAVCADVVVAIVAFQAMEACHRRRDWISADIALGGE